MISVTAKKAAYRLIIAQVQSGILMQVVESVYSAENRTCTARVCDKFHTSQPLRKTSVLISQSKTSNIL